MRGSVARLRADEGFTLTELMVIALILAILLGIALVSYMASAHAAEAAVCRHNQQTLEQVVAVNGCKPDGSPFLTLGDLEAGVGDFESVDHCPSDGTPLLFNAQTGDLSCPNHP